jgi:hypothetical protein
VIDFAHEANISPKVRRGIIPIGDFLAATNRKEENQRKKMAQEPSQHDELASDEAMLYAELAALAQKDRLVMEEDMERLRDAADMARCLAARSDGVALLMRAVVRLIRRGWLDRQTVALLRSFERAYPSELRSRDDEYQDDVAAVPMPIRPHNEQQPRPPEGTNYPNYMEVTDYAS